MPQEEGCAAISKEKRSDSEETVTVGHRCAARIAARHPRRHDGAMMKMPLAVQLFVTIAASSITIMMLSAWASDRRLERGFTAYQHALERDRIDALSAALVRAARTGGIESVGHREWRRLVAGVMRRSVGVPLEPLFADRDDTPATPRRSGDPLRFGDRIALLAPDGRLLAGAPPGAAVATYEVVAGGRLIARLALAPMDRATDERELAWLTSQREQLVWHAGLTIAGAVVLSVLLSAWWSHRIRRVATATARIAGGDLSVRVRARGGDEIGRLAGHVNAMAASLAALEDARRRWLSNVAHELRTPLTTLQGEIEALRDGLRTPDDRALASLHEEVLRLARLTTDLHQLAMAERDGFTLDRAPVDLAALVGRTAARWSGLLARSNLALQTTCTPDLHVVADADRLVQVLDNLLANAARHTDPGGVVVVTGLRSGPDVSITVEDSAPGVSDDVLPRLFEPLFRTPEGRRRDRSGSGLGLALVRALVVAHGGAVEARASALGGLAITIRLPEAR